MLNNMLEINEESSSETLNGSSINKGNENKLFQTECLKYFFSVDPISALKRHLSVYRGRVSERLSDQQEQGAPDGRGGEDAAGGGGRARRTKKAWKDQHGLC